MQRGRWIIFVLIVAASAAFLIYYSVRKNRPDIPSDELHLAVRGRPTDCLACHGAGGSRPRTPNHPFGQDCEQCHYLAGEPR